MQEQIKQLYEEIQREFPNSHPELKLFPSGAAMLYVDVGPENYCLEYHLDVGVGISKASTAVFGWEGYEHPFDTFEDATKFLLSLLKKGPSIESC